MSWDGVVRLRKESLESLAARHGGRVLAGAGHAASSVVPASIAGAGDIAPLVASRYRQAAREAADRGAALLVDESLGDDVAHLPAVWIHEHANWALAALLDEALVPDIAAVVGKSSRIAPTAVLGPRVVIGARVSIAAGSVVGSPGFGWAMGPNGATRSIPQLGGVFIEDDVFVGPLCTIDSGTLSPTRIRAGVKLDAHVHVGHNVDIGERTMVAAQCGFAGSVKIGCDVLVGGQVGIADHVRVGDGARIAAKSGVIGDVPAGATVAGYPAVPRSRWLRALASLYRGVRERGPHGGGENPHHGLPGDS